MDLHIQSHTEILNHLCKILALSIYVVWALDRGTEWRKYLKLAKTKIDSAKSFCTDSYISHFAIPTSNQVLKWHNHLCTRVLRASHTCDTFLTYGCGGIHANICKRDIQQSRLCLYLIRCEIRFESIKTICKTDSRFFLLPFAWSTTILKVSA